VSAQINEVAEVEVDSLTANEIKEKLKELGISTKLRNLKKLKELLRDSLKNKENLPNNM
jgi:hypothetical protein